MNPILDIAANATAGERLALVLFATMALVAMIEDAFVDRDAGPTPAEIFALRAARALQRRAWRLICWAAIAFSPFHAAWLIGRPFPTPMIAIGDLFASGFACASLMLLIASLAVERGISAEKIARGTWMNAAILLFLVALACLTH